MGECYGWGKPIHYYTPASQTDSSCIVVDGLAPSIALSHATPSHSPISNIPASTLRSRNRPCPGTLPCAVKEVRAIRVAVVRVL